jgi:hypothetical protein
MIIIERFREFRDSEKIPFDVLGTVQPDLCLV